MIGRYGRKVGSMIKLILAVGVGAWLAHGGLLPDPSVYVVMIVDAVMSLVA